MPARSSTGRGLLPWFETGMQDLNDLIPANGDWSLTIAISINTRGQITGEGVFNGTEHGFLLTPVSQ